MNRIKLVLSSFLFILVFAVEAKSPPPGTGKADVPANIYIMLDTSGSMGSQITSSNSLRYPMDVAVDSSGNMYVVEYYNHRVRKVDSAGKFIKNIGSYGFNSNGRFYYPTKIDIDSNDNIYVSDRNRIQKLSSDGVWQRNFTGTGSNSTRNIAVDSSGNVFAINSNGRDIYKWNSSGASQGGVSCGQNCYGLDEYNGTLYATDETTRQIKKWSSSTMGTMGTWNINNHYYARDLAVNAQGIFVTSLYYNRIYKYSLSGGVFMTRWGTYGTDKYGFRYPYGIASDSSNKVYVADRSNHAVKIYDANGTYVGMIGSPPDTRMSEAIKVMKKLVSSSDLTKGANFGLQTWASSAYQRIKVDDSGAKKIYDSMDSTNAAAYSPSWYRPSGGTNLDRSMQEAYDYFTGSNSPINSNANCQKNFLMVISDGAWRDTKASTLAKNLYDQKGIVTFVIGFHAGGGNSNYIKLAKAGGSHPESPLYSSNWQHLYETLSAYIRQAISSRLTFSAPVIMPNISSGDHIFQSTFTYKNNHQWEGQLSKFKLVSNGSGTFKAGVGPLLWEAGSKLNAKSDASRNVWTVASSFGLGASINNFSTANVKLLKNALWENSGSNPSDDQATKLINFVRGLDAYDENANKNTAERRWKLGDIYNSRLIVVGPTNAKVSSKATDKDTEAYYRYQNNYLNFKSGATCGGSCKNRKEVVYVGANDGMLHAFDSSNGEEMWAFIPPTMLQSLKDMIAAKANSSNAIYGVDGSPMVKDIFYDSKWRTVLISGMGKGGKGYFALDITNPLSPSFLFAFQHNPADQSIYHWTENGARSTFSYGAGIPAEFDYSKLGDSMSTPAIIKLPLSTGDKWVAVMGAGYNAGVNKAYGSSIYIIDLEDQGKVLNRLDLSSSASNLIANSVPADVVSITPDTTSKAKYKGSMVYLVDLEGKQWKLNLTDKGNLYDITPMFDAEASLENDRMEFFQVTPSIGSDDNLWTFYGTGNQQKLQRISSNINNRLFGLKDVNFPTYQNVSTSTASSSLKNMSSTGVTCPTDSSLGWYTNMGANERITGKLALFNEVVYASRYIPNKGQLCSPGTAYLSEHSMSCGSQSRKTKLGEGIATGAVVFNGVIYVGISGSGDEDIYDDKGKLIGKKKDNIIILEPQGSGTIGDGQITQESWREIY